MLMTKSYENFSDFLYQEKLEVNKSDYLVSFRQSAVIPTGML